MSSRITPNGQVQIVALRYIADTEQALFSVLAIFRHSARTASQTASWLALGLLNGILGVSRSIVLLMPMQMFDKAALSDYNSHNAR